MIQQGRPVTVTLTAEQAMQIEVICMDRDSNEALAFLDNLRTSIAESTVRGIKSHLDK